MKLVLASLTAVAAVLAVAPASATAYTVTLSPSTISSVPTTPNSTPQYTAVAAGADQIYYQFTTTLATMMSATFQSPNPAFQFGATTPTTMGAITLYVGQTCFDGGCTGGVVLPLDASSTPTSNGQGTSVSSSNNYLLANNYTLAVSGTAPAGGANVNSLISFAAPAPEPATWGLMVLGFGAIGAALRTSRRKVVFA